LLLIEVKLVPWLPRPPPMKTPVPPAGRLLLLSTSRLKRIVDGLEAVPVERKLMPIWSPEMMLLTIVKPLPPDSVLIPSTVASRTVKPSMVTLPTPTPTVKAGDPDGGWTMDSRAGFVRPERASTPACAPRMNSDLFTVTDSLYVPAQTRMVSPADAALTAA
jgi:hypothetical protein